MKRIKNTFVKTIFCPWILWLRSTAPISSRATVLLLKGFSLRALIISSRVTDTAPKRATTSDTAKLAQTDSVFDGETVCHGEGER